MRATSFDFTSCWLAYGCEPTPTPASGWLPITVAVTLIRCDRPLVALCHELPLALATKPAAAASAATSAATTTTFLLGRSASAIVTTSAAAKSTTMLDCEYE